MTIPYVVAASTDRAVREADLTAEYGSRGARLAYRVPREGDRDHHGNLWVRMESAGEGRPMLGQLHPLRQRRCMEEMLCQVCGEPAGRTRDGWLFIDWRRPESPPAWPERSVTAMPPVCEDHARDSLRACPFLGTRAHAVLRVRKPSLYGVSGLVYRYTATGWTATDDNVLTPYSGRQLPGMLATRLHRELRGVTLVELV